MKNAKKKVKTSTKVFIGVVLLVVGVIVLSVIPSAPTVPTMEQSVGVTQHTLNGWGLQFDGTAIFSHGEVPETVTNFSLQKNEAASFTMPQETRMEVKPLRGAIRVILFDVNTGDLWWSNVYDAQDGTSFSWISPKTTYVVFVVGNFFLPAEFSISQPELVLPSITP